MWNQAFFSLPREAKFSLQFQISLPKRKWGRTLVQSMEELGDQCKVVFSGLTAGISWEIGRGRGKGGFQQPPTPPRHNHTLTSLLYQIMQRRPRIGLLVPPWYCARRDKHTLGIGGCSVGRCNYEYTEEPTKYSVGPKHDKTDVFTVMFGLRTVLTIFLYVK